MSQSTEPGERIGATSSTRTKVKTRAGLAFGLTFSECYLLANFLISVVQSFALSFLMCTSELRKMTQLLEENSIHTGCWQSLKNPVE